jgi:hypothetical protein
MATKKRTLKRKVIVLKHRGGTMSLVAVRKKVKLLNSGAIKSVAPIPAATRERILLAA